jgi:hypothetical protein
MSADRDDDRQRTVLRSIFRTPKHVSGRRRFRKLALDEFLEDGLMHSIPIVLWGARESGSFGRSRFYACGNCLNRAKIQ